MAKYVLQPSSGFVFPKMDGVTVGDDTPVIVIPEADWKELVMLSWMRNNGSDEADKIKAIIQRTAANNG